MKIRILILLFFPFMAMGQGKLDSLREKLVKDNTYEYVYYFENNYAVFRTFDEKMGLLVSAGNVIIKPIFSSIRNRKELVNLFEVGNKINNKFKRGFVDVKGNIIIPMMYDDVYYVGKELIRVTLNNKYGVLDTVNRVILPAIYDYVSFDNDIIIAGLNGVRSLYDDTGKQISNLQFTAISRFHDNRAIITNEDKSTSIIDHHGNIILEPMDGFSFERVLNDSLVLIKNALNSKVGIVNAKGEFAISCNYDEVKQANTFFIAESNNKKGILSVDESIVMPFVYDEIYLSYFYVVDGFDDYEIGENYIVKKDNLFGVIDPNTENEIIPVHYKSISTLFDKYYLVQNTEERNGLFLENGEALLLEEYIFYNRFEKTIFATKNNKPLLIKLEGKRYTETEVGVDEFIQFKDDDSLFLNEKQIFKLNDKYGVINYESSILIPGEYEFIENITYSDEFIVKKNNKYGIVNAENSTVVEFEYDEYKEFKAYMLLTKEKPAIIKYHPISFKY